MYCRCGGSLAERYRVCTAKAVLIIVLLSLRNVFCYVFPLGPFKNYLMLLGGEGSTVKCYKCNAYNAHK